jgi:hypothetical protein
MRNFSTPSERHLSPNTLQDICSIIQQNFETDAPCTDACQAPLLDASTTKLPRELRDAVYDELLTVELLWQLADFLQNKDNHANFKHMLTHSLNPKYLGKQIATELAETAFKKLFSHCTFALMINESDSPEVLREPLTMDVFSLGVTPLRFLRRVHIGWHIMGSSEEEDDVCSEKLFEALHLLEARPGLEVDIQVQPAMELYRISRLAPYLEAFRPTHEFFTQAGIPYSLYIQHSEGRPDLGVYYAKPLSEWRKYMIANNGTFDISRPRLNPCLTFCSSILE